MKKTITLLLISLLIFLASCKANTGPIEDTDGKSVPKETLKSVGPVLGEIYLWIKITPGETESSVSIRFGNSTSESSTTGGETITYDANIQDTSPTDGKNNTTYAFQTGTITGSLEILDSKRAQISFTQNVAPYIKVMEAVCEIPVK